MSKRDSDEQSSEREVGDDEFKTLASSLVLNEGRGLRRERNPRKAWEFTISLGLPNYIIKSSAEVKNTMDNNFNNKNCCNYS